MTRSDFSVNRFGRRWLTTTRKRKEARLQRRKEKLEQMSAQDHIMHMVCPIQFCMIRIVEALLIAEADGRLAHVARA